MKFRKDINSLRAIAVIAVVIFHFNSNLIPGGFAGVDIFFVISGYLMTSIIVNGIKNKNFSITEFYSSRAKRLIPALAFLCLFLIIFGWFFILPIDYRETSKQIINSLTFISNIIFSQQTGYFSLSSHEKWLLHTWSLSVEWQFYIIYPILLTLLIKRISLEKTYRTILFIALASFIFSIYSSNHWPESAYFWLPTRAWELLVGGLAFIYPIKFNKNLNNLVYWIGISIIIASYFLISKNNIWPGYLAIFPITGAFLIITTNIKNNFINNNIFFNKIGLWSYSIYLWHWPIAVLGFYYNIQHWIYLGIPLSVLFGFISYTFIERQNKKNTISIKKLILLILFIGIAANFIYKNNGFHNRLPEELINIENYSKNIYLEQSDENKKLSKDCEVGNLATNECNRFNNDNYVKGIIIGDSHAAAIASSINKSIKSHNPNYKVINLGAYGCLPINGVVHTDDKRKNCRLYNKKLFNFLNTEYKDIPVILAARINLYPFGFNEKQQKNKPYITFDGINNFSQSYLNSFKIHFVNSICEIAKHHPIYILKPTPEFIVNTPKEIQKEIIQGHKPNIFISVYDYNIRNEFSNTLLQEVKNKCNAHIIDINNNFLDKSKKYYHANIGNTPLFSDDNHLNIYGANLASKDFDRVWSKL